MATNADDVVERCSRKAFTLLPDVLAAITELSSLKALGPATASGQQSLQPSGVDLGPYRATQGGLGLELILCHDALDDCIPVFFSKNKHV